MLLPPNRPNELGKKPKKAADSVRRQAGLNGPSMQKAARREARALRRHVAYLNPKPSVSFHVAASDAPDPIRYVVVVPGPLSFARNRRTHAGVSFSLATW